MRRRNRLRHRVHLSLIHIFVPFGTSCRTVDRGHAIHRKNRAESCQIDGNRLAGQGGVGCRDQRIIAVFRRRESQAARRYGEDARSRLVDLSLIHI